MEKITPFENILRMKQVYVVGGNGYKSPSEFVRKVNQNIKIIGESDNNAKVEDIKFNVHTDPQYGQYGPVYLAFITATVDVNMTPKVQDDGITRKQKKKKKRK
jgi:hypothetical protein